MIADIKKFINEGIVNLDNKIRCLFQDDELYTDNSKWLQEGWKIDVGGIDRTITGIYDGVITLDNTTGLVEGTIYDVYIPTPKFYYGLIKDFNSKLEQYNDYTDKLPCFYLLEEYTVTDLRFDEMNSNSCIYDIRLYFLTQADYIAWQREDFEEKAIQPMLALYDEYINSLNKVKYVDISERITITTKTRISIYINIKGLETALLVDNLSGVEAVFSVKINKENNC